MSATTSATTSRSLDVVLDIEHCNKNLSETLCSLLSMVPADYNFRGFWLVRSTPVDEDGNAKPVQPVSVSVPLTEKWVQQTPSHSILLSHSVSKGRYSSVAVSSHIQGWYAARAETTDTVLIVTSRASTFVSDSFSMFSDVEVCSGVKSTKKYFYGIAGLELPIEETETVTSSDESTATPTTPVPSTPIKSEPVSSPRKKRKSASSPVKTA